MDAFTNNPLFRKTLLFLADKLNKQDVTWGLGGSMLLNFYGIVDSVNDIDIVVDIKDRDKLLDAIKECVSLEKSVSTEYLTDYFYAAFINRVEIDFMLNFKVRTEAGLYVFPFGKDKIEKQVELDGITVNLCRLSEWEKAYRAMGRENKADLIAEYFKQNR